MPTPGVLMRLSDASTIQAPLTGVDIEAIYTLKADDDKHPSGNTLYFLRDITPLLSSADLHNADIEAHRAITAPPPSWILCSFINGRDAGDSEAQQSQHVLPTPPPLGSILVINGSTPRPEKEDDYHAWYALARVYGEAETASFYGFNFYDADNGLGGPEWQAGVTEWTLRIRSNAAKPNIRRVWRVVQT